MSQEIADYLEDGMIRIRTRYPDAYYETGKSGSHLIVVPNYILPKGYSHKTCTVLFAAPPGFPACSPTNFWIDVPELSLLEPDQSSGYMWSPAWTNDRNPIPGFPNWNNKTRFFRRQLQAWHWTSTLYTYLMVIKQRLEPAR